MGSGATTTLALASSWWRSARPGPRIWRTSAPAAVAGLLWVERSVQVDAIRPPAVRIHAGRQKVRNRAFHRSRYISQQAGPYLQQETLQAQSAQIDIVSGATYTSDSWAQSLQSALARAHA